MPGSVTVAAEYAPLIYRPKERRLQHKVSTIRRDYGIQHIGSSNGSSEEGDMCPACIASTAVMVAGAGSTGGILAVCIGKFRKFFRANHLSLVQKIKEK